MGMVMVMDVAMGEGEGGSFMDRRGWEGRFSILRMLRRGVMGGDLGWICFRWDGGTFWVRVDIILMT